MQTSDEIKARLHHGSHELAQVQQLVATIQHLVATASDQIKTTYDDIQVCSDRADLIDPAISALTDQIHALTEEMDRVYSLRNDESDLYLRQENNKLKREIAALQQALTREREEHQTRLAASVKSNEELVQRNGSLERFCQMLKSKLNELKEMYESAIIDVAELKATNKTLQNTPAFNVVANTAASNIVRGGSSTGSIPFGRTVVETNRGLTVTIESSPTGSPDKASLNHGWRPAIPSSAAFPFPDIVHQPQFTSLSPTNEESTQVTMRTPGRSKARPIVRGTQEANDSFERMKRSLASTTLIHSTDVTKDETTHTATSPSPTVGLPMPVITPFDAHPVTPSKVKSKLNPAVAAFTPSDSSGKESGKSGSVLASSPTVDGPKLSVTATNVGNEGFISPEPRRVSKMSMEEGPVTTAEELHVGDKLKYPNIVATSAQDLSAKEAEPTQAPSFPPRILPHLQHLHSVSLNKGVHPSLVQSSDKGKKKEDTVDSAEPLPLGSALTGTKQNLQAAAYSVTFARSDPELQAWLDVQEKSQSNNASSHGSSSPVNDMLIEIDPYSPQAGKKKSPPLPPGFTPMSANDAPAKTETAAPIKTNNATSLVAVFDTPTNSDPFSEKEEVTAEHKAAAKITSEKERNAAFLAEYTKTINSVTQKYARGSRHGFDEKEGEVDPIKYEGAKPDYIPSKPTGTHKLGALLDDECSKLVLKPRKAAVKVMEPVVGQEWKAVRKGGKVVYVL